MIATDELKEVFREGWSNHDRVENWVNRCTCGEFENIACRRAWLDVLSLAAARGTVRDTLDAGTGPGTIAQIWSELGFRSTGLDFSPTMIAAGRKLIANNNRPVTFIEGDAECPPFEEASFDLVSSRLVLFTLPHPGYAIHRWTQLLKPDGLVVLIGEDAPTDPEKKRQQDGLRSKWQPDERYREALGQLPFMGHTARTLSVVMEAAGLRDIQSLPMEAVIAARTALNQEAPSHGVFQSTPFVLVGQK